jgi:hypothetical protein
MSITCGPDVRSWLDDCSGKDVKDVEDVGLKAYHTHLCYQEDRDPKNPKHTEGCEAVDDVGVGRDGKAYGEEDKGGA